MGLQPRFSSPEEYQAYKKELERRWNQRASGSASPLKKGVKGTNRVGKRKKIYFYLVDDGQDEAAVFPGKVTASVSDGDAANTMAGGGHVEGAD